MNSWRYYNYALVPSCAPHEQPNEEALKDKSLWTSKGNALLARWTTDYDCKEDTQWWYVIKDEPFDIDSLKSNYRYKINKGRKYFDVKLIDPTEYMEELYQVQVDAFSAYPPKSRPTVIKEQFFDMLKQTKEQGDAVRMYGAFFRETGELCGYVRVPVYESYADLQTQKTKPSFEKYQLNAALVYGLLDSFKEALSGDFYICDGTRSINHETAFQDYLEKYFNFRKAYARLRIVYSPKIAWIVKILFPFRRALMLFDNIGAAHRVNAILKMEEIHRVKRS